MRGTFVDQGGLFSYIAPEARVPVTHPLRKIREIVRDVLGELTRSLGRLYASEGRPSIPPEQLLSALLLQVFYGIRSERQLMERGRREQGGKRGDKPTTESIAKRERCSVRKVNMTLSLAFLAPDLVKAAIDGRLPHGMGVARLADLPAEISNANGGALGEAPVVNLLRWFQLLRLNLNSCSYIRIRGFGL